MARELKKILYAEDDLDIQSIVQIILKYKSNFQLECCETGTRVLEIAPLFNPDLIILDINMPEMDGPTTFEFLKKNKDLKDIPVIFMTAKVQKHEIESYYKMGVIHVIIKLLILQN